VHIITVAAKSELDPHLPAIEALFDRCFGRRMSNDVWRWAYLDNPHGEPLVSLCYDGDALVGHYGMIPLPLSSEERRVNTYLSITTMVAPSHRKYGLFEETGEAIYAKAVDRRVDWVMGFPNAAATPGRRRRLHWRLPAPDSVVSVGRSELLDLRRHLPVADRTSYRLRLGDETTRRWRLSRPGATYHWRDGLAYKEFGEEIDLIGFSDVDQLEALPEGRKINLLVPASVVEFESRKRFEYQFGGRSLCSELVPEQIVRQMCLSDVF